MVLGEAGTAWGVGSRGRHHVIPLSPLSQLGAPLTLEEDAGQRVGHHPLVAGLDAWGLEVAVVPPPLLQHKNVGLLMLFIANDSHSQ